MSRITFTQGWPLFSFDGPSPEPDWNSRMKPCPLCGGAPWYEVEPMHWPSDPGVDDFELLTLLECSKCGGHTSSFPHDRGDLAERAWNDGEVFPLPDAASRPNLG